MATLEGMPILYFFGIMVTFWSVLLTLIHYFERRMAWPYGELQKDPPFADATGYGKDRVAEAMIAERFTLLGWARDLKGPKYKVSYAMLVSPDANVFAIIGVGSILNIPLTATWLFTPTADGKCFYSTDHQSGVSIDLSHHWTNQLVPGTSFVSLLQQHRSWIQASAMMPRPFTHGQEAAEFRALREQHYRAMQQNGLIDFTDASSQHFRFTLSGAAMTATWGYFVGMARALTQGRFPRNA